MLGDCGGSDVPAMIGARFLFVSSVISAMCGSGGHSMLRPLYSDRAVVVSLPTSYWLYWS